MCKDNSCIWLILLIVIFFNCKNQDNSSTPLNFDTFFGVESSSPLI
jgi:hypothetical protein